MTQHLEGTVDETLDWLYGHVIRELAQRLRLDHNDVASIHIEPFKLTVYHYLTDENGTRSATPGGSVRMLRLVLDYPPLDEEQQP